MRTAVLGAWIAAALLCSSPALPQPASSSPVLGDSPDGTSSQQNPVVVFSTPGVKTVTFTVCNASQQCSTLTQTLTVLDPTPTISGQAVVPNPVALNGLLTLTAAIGGQPQLAASWWITGAPGGPLSFPGPVANLNPLQAGLAPGPYSAYLVLSNPAGRAQSPAIGFTVTPAEHESFYTVAPCRALDTRVTANPLVGGQPLTVNLATCGLPSSARAAVVNLTAIAPSADGSLMAWPSDQPIPGTSNLSYRAGAVRAAFSIVPLARSGATLNVAAALGGSTDLVIDVAGYFAP